MLVISAVTFDSEAEREKDRVRNADLYQYLSIYVGACAINIAKFDILLEKIK